MGALEGLRRFWLFADLEDEEICSLTEVAVTLRAADGEMLFGLGDPTPGLHLVEAGAIKIYTLTPEGEERIIDIVGPGQFCGEMGVVDAAPSSAWGEALGPTACRVIPPEAFERLLLANPRLSLKLCRALVAKLRAASQQLDDATFLGARQRVLRRLAYLAERHGRPCPEGTLVPLRLTHEEVARMAGTARETVSRVLSELQERGVVSFVGRQMLIRNVDALMA